MAPMWKKLMKHVDLDEPTPFLDHAYLGCTQRECELNEYTVEKHKDMFGSRISAGATENYQDGGKPHAKTSAWSYDMEGHAEKSVERYCDSANKKRQSNCTKFQVLAWNIITSRKKNLNQLENYQKFAHKLY